MHGVVTLEDVVRVQVTGVITLEDILEEVIRAEIIDEHDTFVANDSMQRVRKVRTHACGLERVPLTRRRQWPRACGL
jgi:Mg2+/Co2+ transporter CorC